MDVRKLIIWGSKGTLHIYELMPYCQSPHLKLSIDKEFYFWFFNDGRGDVTITLMFSVGYDYRMQMKFLFFKYKGPLLIFFKCKVKMISMYMDKGSQSGLGVPVSYFFVSVPPLLIASTKFHFINSVNRKLWWAVDQHQNHSIHIKGWVSHCNSFLYRDWFEQSTEANIVFTWETATNDNKDMLKVKQVLSPLKTLLSFIWNCVVNYKKLVRVSACFVVSSGNYSLETVFSGIKVPQVFYILIVFETFFFFF